MDRLLKMAHRCGRGLRNSVVAQRKQRPRFGLRRCRCRGVFVDAAHDLAVGEHIVILEPHRAAWHGDGPEPFRSAPLQMIGANYN
jgi:hypothetical protein